MDRFLRQHGGVLSIGDDGKYVMGPAPSMDDIDNTYTEPSSQPTTLSYRSSASRGRSTRQNNILQGQPPSTHYTGGNANPQNRNLNGQKTVSLPPNPDGDEDTLKEKESGEDDAEGTKGEEEAEGGGGDGDGDGGEGGEKGKKSPPTPVGFWDPALKHVRHEAMWKWALTTTVLMIFIWAVLSIYWASLFHVDQNISSLVIAVVDMDGAPPYNTHTPIVGPEIVRLALEQTKSPMHLGYVAPAGSIYGNDPIQVRQAVYDFEFWAAIIINPNATAMLYSAIETGNTSYDPLGACQLVYIDSRDDTNWYDFIYPLLSTLVTQATSSVGMQWTKTALGLASNNATILANLQRVPQALSPAIGFSMYNLRPFYPYTTIPAITVGLIYLIIISFFSFSFYLPIHFKYLKPEGHPPLKFYQLVTWRWCATILAYLFLSFAYSLLSLAFQINFNGGNPVTSETQPTMIEYGNPDAYGRGTFPVYWMLNYVGMIALGLACENVAMLVGQPWSALWLILWVITNVSTSFYDIDIEPAIYRFGYAFPLHNIVEASRQILFGLHSRIGLNFGILFAWGAINTALFPLCCMWMRYRTRHGLHEYWA